MVSKPRTVKRCQPHAHGAVFAGWLAMLPEGEFLPALCRKKLLSWRLGKAGVRYHKYEDSTRGTVIGSAA